MLFRSLSLQSPTGPRVPSPPPLASPPSLSFPPLPDPRSSCRRPTFPSSSLLAQSARRRPGRFLRDLPRPPRSASTSSSTTSAIFLDLERDDLRDLPRPRARRPPRSASTSSSTTSAICLDLEPDDLRDLPRPQDLHDLPRPSPSIPICTV